MTRHVAVIDIGKTNAKLVLVSLPDLGEITVVTRPNITRAGPPWPHFDTDGHWAFLLDTLAKLHASHRIDAISITTHGACAALLAADGTLAAPILDYEHTYPDEIRAAYRALKPDFAQTGSPDLEGGLNIGAQVHYQFCTDPSLRDRTAKIVTYPQYWGHRLTGIAATDVTSIGCHTDLWCPREGRFSTLAAALGIADKIAPVRRCADVLGPILPRIARATGLCPDTPICVGIHDSNASLYPHILQQEGAFSVVSTGTWVVVMTMGGSDVALDPARDTLINVNALGQPVPSARFMGGREYELIQQGHTTSPTASDIENVLCTPVLLLPAVVPSSGPFQGRTAHWVGPEPALGSGTRAAALSYYLALMTDACLTLTGATGPTIIEGPFATNTDFLAMLAAATDRPVLISTGVTGTTTGAALLCTPDTPFPAPIPAAAPDNLSHLRSYAEDWRRRTAAQPKP